MPGPQHTHMGDNLSEITKITVHHNRIARNNVACGDVERVVVTTNPLNLYIIVDFVYVYRLW